MITHHHPEEILHCLNEHLAELVEMTGGRTEAIRMFNLQSSKLFVLLYDDNFGVWLIRAE